MWFSFNCECALRLEEIALFIDNDDALKYPLYDRCLWNQTKILEFKNAMLVFQDRLNLNQFIEMRLDKNDLNRILSKGSFM